MPSKKRYWVKSKKKRPSFKSGFGIENQKVFFSFPSLIESETTSLTHKQKRLYSKPDNHFFQEKHAQKIYPIKQTARANSKDMRLTKPLTTTSVNIVCTKGCAEIESAVIVVNAWLLSKIENKVSDILLVWTLKGISATTLAEMQSPARLSRQCCSVSPSRCATLAGLSRSKALPSVGLAVYFLNV